ncbi:MAG: hypothetical protein C0417_12230 [Chlorobiaceae bacterium]|nr:hypothetical protein [Chlorobiaceae bacterium]
MILDVELVNAQPTYDHWNILIKAQNSQINDSLANFGIRPDATSDFDNAYDIPRPPRAPSGNYLEVYFPHSGSNFPPLLGSKYAVDFQGPIDPTWNFSVEASLAGPISLTWDMSYLNSIEERLQLFLLDLTNGNLIDMRANEIYTFSYTAKRDFQIIGAVNVGFKYIMEGFWNGTAQVRDTVSGYLAQSVFPFSFIDSSQYYLSSSGTGRFIFKNAVSGNYYFVIRHRNHIEIWTSISLDIVKGTTSFTEYDFTNHADAAFGSGALKPIGAVYAAWGGDVNQDGVIDYLDRNITWNNRGINGRLSSDCNGDNNTDATDLDIVLNNRYKTIQKP